MTIEYDADDGSGEDNASEHDLESGGVSESDEATDDVDEQVKDQQMTLDLKVQEDDFFEEMPPELVWLVAGQLEHQDLARLALTCHRMADLVSDPLLWKLNIERAWRSSSDQASGPSSALHASQNVDKRASSGVSAEDLFNSDRSPSEDEERGKEIGEGMAGGPLSGGNRSPDVDSRESGSEDEGALERRARRQHSGDRTGNDDTEVTVEVVRASNRNVATHADDVVIADRDWKELYRSRLDHEHRGWKAKNIQRLSKKVTTVDTHHNATFITSLLVNRPPVFETAKMTKARAHSTWTDVCSSDSSTLSLA
jgi:hypothetical protein